MADIEKRQQYVQLYRSSSIAWRERGDLVREGSSLSGLLMNYLAISVQVEGGLVERRRWLREHTVVNELDRCVDVVSSLIGSVSDGGLGASSVPVGTYHLAAFAHVAWAIEEHDLGTRFAALSANHFMQSLSTKFWSEYVQGVDAIIKGRPYERRDFPLRGIERHWNAYLNLIEQAANDGSLDDAVADVDQAFITRNLAALGKDDPYEIEGSRAHPVRWDFRRDGLLELIRSTGGKTL